MAGHIDPHAAHLTQRDADLVVAEDLADTARDHLADLAELHARHRNGPDARNGDAAAAVDALLADGVVAGVPFSRLDPGAGMDDVLLVAATETTTTQDIQTFAQALARRTA